MNHSARTLAAAALLAAVWLFPRPVAACKCMLLAPNEAAAQASAVFEGRVVEVTDGQGAELPRRSATLRVVRGWKGAQSERAVVTTASDSAACGVHFVRDQNYLIYATTQDGTLSATSCSRTRPSAEAEEDFAALGMGWTPVDPKTQDSATKPRSKAEPPARGGCAGCAIAGRHDSRLGLACLLLPALWLARATYRRRSGSRS
jgi:hypothetical protein